MTMINDDPGARSRQNPRTAAREFARNSPFLNRPDTMSGRLQPALSEQEEPMSALERGLAGPSWIDEQNVTVQREQEALQDATSRAVQAVQQRQQAQMQPSQQETSSLGDRRVYQPDGSLSQPRQQILQQTSQYAGSPYRLGGRTAQGIDCSGLVMSVYNSMGFDIKSHSVSGQARSIPGVKTSVNNLKPGDLVVWNDNSHIAIYAGNGQIWDASRSRGTSLRPLWGTPNEVYGIAVRLPGE
jgi:cell wall-associated NlpC family hydrolase